MASRAKAAAPAAGGEAKTQAEVEAELVDLLQKNGEADQAKAEAEKPKSATAKKNGEAKAEEPKKPAKKKKLALNEVEGDVADGAKVRIGVQSFKQGGGEVIRTLVVPKAWKIVGPASRSRFVHVVDVDHPERTICTLPTNWASGMVEYPADTFINCEPCARRMIAINKMKEAEHEKRRKAAEAAATKRREAEVEAATKAKAEKAKAKEAEAAKTVEAAPEPEAKPDPKPSARRTRKAA